MYDMGSGVYQWTHALTLGSLMITSVACWLKSTHPVEAHGLQIAQMQKVLVGVPGADHPSALTGPWAVGKHCTLPCPFPLMLRCQNSPVPTDDSTHESGNHEVNFGSMTNLNKRHLSIRILGRRSDNSSKAFSTIRPNLTMNIDILRLWCMFTVNFDE